jgi:hypothetical protein
MANDTLETFARKYFANLDTREDGEKLAEALETFLPSQFPVEILVDFPRLRITAALIFAQEDGFRSITGRIRPWPDMASTTLPAAMRPKD